MQIKGSKICDHDECISVLTKDIYTPCHRTDLGGCLRACKCPLHGIRECVSIHSKLHFLLNSTSCFADCKSGLVNCTAVSAAEEKCMTDAGTKNGEELVKHCSGVDFDALKKGDVRVPNHVTRSWEQCVNLFFF